MFSYSSMMHQYFMAKKRAQAAAVVRETAAREEWVQRGLTADKFTMDKMAAIWEMEELATFCIGITKSGGRCRRKSGSNANYCHLHRTGASPKNCMGITKGGGRCKRKTGLKKGYCHLHKAASEEN